MGLFPPADGREISHETIFFAAVADYTIHINLASCLPRTIIRLSDEEIIQCDNLGKNAPVFIADQSVCCDQRLING